MYDAHELGGGGGGVGRFPHEKVREACCLA